MFRRRAFTHIAPPYAPFLRAAGIGPEEVFGHPSIVPWRTLGDRDNCTLDLRGPDGAAVRLHVKRYRSGWSSRRAARREVEGLRLLRAAGVPTAELAAWGELADGRSFVMLADLAGYRPADTLVAGGLPFDRLLLPTARLAARLHGAGLHHRDLYLCHFFVAELPPELDVRLIDAARVRRLPRWPLRRRWIVKDLAQFCYSLACLGIGDEGRRRWLACWSDSYRQPLTSGLLAAVDRKVAAIARHDARLRQRQPLRNVSIPGR